MRLIDADALLEVISNAEPINLGWVTDRITNAPAVQREEINGKRLNWLLDWYMRGGMRAEIIPNGHIQLYTKEDVIKSIDAILAASPTDKE